MAFTYAIVRTDDTITWYKDDKAPDYDTINAAVGGWLEGVPVRDVTAYINEEGKLKGLPQNKTATALAHRDEAIYPHDYIAGDMFVAGPLDEDGDITSLSEHWVADTMFYMNTLQVQEIVTKSYSGSQEG